MNLRRVSHGRNNWNRNCPAISPDVLCNHEPRSSTWDAHVKGGKTRGASTPFTHGQMGCHKTVSFRGNATRIRVSFGLF